MRKQNLRPWVTGLLAVFVLSIVSCSRYLVEETYLNHPVLFSSSLAELSYVLNTNFDGSSEKLSTPRYSTLDVTLLRLHDDAVVLTVAPEILFSFDNRNQPEESWRVTWQLVVSGRDDATGSAEFVGYSYIENIPINLGPTRSSRSRSFQVSTIQNASTAPLLVIGRQYDCQLHARIESVDTGTYWEVRVATVVVDLRSLSPR